MRGRAPLSGSPEKCDRSPPAIVAPGAESDSAPGAACGPMDADMFVALCMAQVTPLYRYFVHQIGNVHDAEDLMATTVSKALASITRFDPASGTFAAWLFGIARHTLRDFQRRQRPVSDIAMVSAPLIDSAPALDMQIVRIEEATLLLARVRQLPTGQREALTLRYFGALKAAEIARVLGRSEGAVRLLIHRALTTLRGQYCQEDRP